MDVRERVVAILAEQALLRPSDVTDDLSPEALGIESLGIVEAIFAIEESFGVSVPFNANDPRASGFDISTVGAIVGGVERLVAERG